MAVHRRPVYFNPDAKSWTAEPVPSPEVIDAFHQKLPDFKPTNLVRLDGIAKELGVRSVHIKDESDRLGLPAFKILGASWGTYRALAAELGLSPDASFDDVRKAAASHKVKLFAATDGNHGRAVARMGSIFSIPVEIYVPANMHPATADLIRNEGATVIETAFTYDESIAEAKLAAGEHNTGRGVLIQDYASEDNEAVAQWVVDGYSTMMREIDAQLNGDHVDLVIAPVGVGSFAQSVVTHFKGSDDKRRASVLAVEPDTAACLWKSLVQGETVDERTTSTIMAGLECGTVSTAAWPILKSGIDASVTVSDYESHRAVQELSTLGIRAGPCGAASLAALRRLSAADKESLGLSAESAIVLICTEGAREYDIPLDTSVNDATALTQTLVQINSASPGLGNDPGPGETEIARYIRAWLEHRSIETHWIEPVKGRPSIIGVVRGTGGGKSLMLNGHIDTVSIADYNGDPFSGEIKGDRLYGRGSADMKGGVAAQMLTLANAKQLNLSGDVIFAGVSDEEDTSIGTESILKAGWRADGAIVSEPTDLQLVNEHKGFVWLEVDIKGTSAHGSRPDLGVDAIVKAGYFLVELDKHAEDLKRRGEATPSPGPSIHASIIKGGEETSSYPALCTITIERRTTASETRESVEREIRELLERVGADVTDFNYSLRVTFERPAFNLPPEHPFASLTQEIVGKHLGEKPEFEFMAAWTDCALLDGAGIPALLWGPRGEGYHSVEEWVDVRSVELVAGALTDLAKAFCK